MNSAILLTIMAVVTLSLAEDTLKEKEKEEKYTDRFDSIDIDEILANRRLLVPYLKCALDKGRCTPEGKELKGMHTFPCNRVSRRSRIV